MKKADEIELARGFLDHAYALVEGGEDTIYELLDPECKYGTDLIRRLNNYTIREILALGFRAKYGEDWHGPVQSSEPQCCPHCGMPVLSGACNGPGAIQSCPHCGLPICCIRSDGHGAAANSHTKAVSGKESCNGRHG